MSASRVVRTLLGSTAFRTGLHRRVLGGRAVITLFHRVRSGVPEHYLSCPPTLFRRYCDFFHRYFNVISVDDLLHRLRVGREVSGCLAITFDDGYRDNFTEARPILEAMALPATFFPTVGFIESGRSAPWDEKRGITSEWMSWEEVRGLIRSGFSIGGHTVDHVDLGAIHGAEAADQIQRAKVELEARTGTTVGLFSYPFGGPDRITEENRRLVEEAGFRCCLSAHGGFVTKDSDPFNLPRVAITDWHGSPEEWGFDLLRAAIGDASGPSGGALDPHSRPTVPEGVDRPVT